ncbi:MAG: hypothetical protein ACXWGU_13475 [Usitatibacter sp.]
MGWQAFKVASRASGDQVAEQLLASANDSATWSLANFGAMVIRLELDDGERFYFSPHASDLFQQLIASHGGEPCNPPLARGLPPSKTSRIVLGFKTHWESFAPPKPARSHGIRGGQGGRDA